MHELKPQQSTCCCSWLLLLLPLSNFDIAVVLTITTTIAVIARFAIPQITVRTEGVNVASHGVGRVRVQFILLPSGYENVKCSLRIQGCV